MPSYLFSFSSINTEQLIEEYIKKNKENEIFLGLMGNVKGKREKNKQYFIYEIKDVIAFPNISKNPKIQATVTDSWYDILNENIILKHSTKNISPIGILHTHVIGEPRPSKADLEFLKSFGAKLRRFLMIIINYRLKKKFNYFGYVIIQDNYEFTIEESKKLIKK